MNAFVQRLKTVPKPAWVAGILISLLIAPALVMGPINSDHEMRWWPVQAKIGLCRC